MADQERPTNVIFNRKLKFVPSSETLIGIDDSGNPLTMTRQQFKMRGRIGTDFDATTLTGREFGFGSLDSDETVFGKPDGNSSDDGKSKFRKTSNSVKILEKLPDDIDEQIIFNFLILNIVFVVLGIVTLIIILVLHLLESGMKEFLIVNHKQTSIPPGLMYISTGISIFLGMGAIIAFLVNGDLFFKLYERVLWSILALNIASIIVSFGSWKLFNVTVYQRIFEAEANFIRTKDHLYLDLWKNINDGFWNKLQRDLRCCGMHGPQDWVKLAGDFVESCCRSTHMDDCKSALKAWRVNKTAAVPKELLHTLYQKDCAFVLGLEVKNLQRDWVLFPSIIAFFNFLLMLQGNYLNRKIKALYGTISGFQSITLFQNKYFSACLLKCRDMKKPRWQHKFTQNGKAKVGRGQEPKGSEVPNPATEGSQPNEQSAPENTPETENKPTSGSPGPADKSELRSDPVFKNPTAIDRDPVFKSLPVLKSILKGGSILESVGTPARIYTSEQIGTKTVMSSEKQTSISGSVKKSASPDQNV